MNTQEKQTARPSHQVAFDQLTVSQILNKKAKGEKLSFIERNILRINEKRNSKTTKK